MKLKQIIVGTMMGLALVLCTDAEAAGCAKNQWLNGKKCAACPANAKCKGGDTVFVCNKGYKEKKW